MWHYGAFSKGASEAQIHHCVNAVTSANTLHEKSSSAISLINLFVQPPPESDYMHVLVGYRNLFSTNLANKIVNLCTKFFQHDCDCCEKTCRYNITKPLFFQKAKKLVQLANLRKIEAFSSDDFLHNYTVALNTFSITTVRRSLRIQGIPADFVPVKNVRAIHHPQFAGRQPLLISTPIIPPNNARKYMNKLADNIDTKNLDQTNEYINNMYDFFRQDELNIQTQMSRNIFQNHPKINSQMFTILIDWLVDVHLNFKLVLETLYLSVNIINRYLNFSLNHQKSELQLIGIAALLIASKYEDMYPCSIQQLLQIANNSYIKSELINMELTICELLNYKLMVPTSHTFLCRHLKASHADRATVQLACFIGESALLNLPLNKYLPSVVSAASVRLARIALHYNSWSQTLVKYTKYDECDLESCCNELISAIDCNKSVFKKYSSVKFDMIATHVIMYKFIWNS